MGNLKIIEGRSLLVSNSSDPGIDGIYVLQKTLYNGKRWYKKDNPDPIVDFAIIYQVGPNPVDNFWELIILFNGFGIYNSNTNADNPWEPVWSNNLNVSAIVLTNNKISIKEQNLTVSNYSIALVNGVYKLQNTLINGRNWYLHSTLLFNVRWNSSINRWQLLSFGGAELSTSTSSANTPWETTWILEAIQVSLGSGGKLNLKKKYLYVATGIGLTPNINGLRFYDTGETFYTNKVFYDETNTYMMWTSPIGYWFIKALPLNPFTPGPAFAKAFSNSGEPPTGNYTGGNGYIGTVTISSI